MTTKIVIALAALVCSVLCAPNDIYEGQFREWREKFEKKYSSENEEVVRREAWQNSLDLMDEINNREDVPFRVEMNQYADGLVKEGDIAIKDGRVLQGRVKLDMPKLSSPLHTKDTETEAPPPSFDWRKKGVISPVKSQGQVISAVAFAAEECVESLNAIKTGKLITLSVAEVSDCCDRLSFEVFSCIHGIGGLCTQEAYPTPTVQCRNSSCQAAVQIAGGRTVPSKRVDLMVDALLERPLMVAVDASRISFDLYNSGIYTDPDCSQTMVDHGLQLVGYGQEGGKDYWICKNSWGPSWGEEGYIRILKGSNMCGIETYASYPYQ